MEKLIPRIPKTAVDRRLILNAVCQKGAISRITLRPVTGLRLASITYAVRQLLHENLLCEGKKVNPKRGGAGRKQVYLELKTDGRYALGMELKRGLVCFLLLNLVGRVVREKKVKIDPEGNSLAILQKITREVDRILEEARIPLKKVVGLGFVDPGVIDIKRGVSLFSSVFPGWKDIPTRQFLEKRFSFPIHLIGTSQAKAVAESLFGAGKGYTDFIFIEYGEGIACGIVSEGRVVRGSLETAGELGHCHFPGNDTPCHCGGVGCLEAICALPAIVRRTKILLASGTESTLRTKVGNELDRLTGVMVLKGFQEGDRLCQRVLEEILEYLGASIANTVNLFNPQLVIFDRTLSYAGQDFLERLKSLIRRQALLEKYLKFAVSPLGEEAGPLGGASFALQHFFANYPC